MSNSMKEREREKGGSGCHCIMNCNCVSLLSFSADMMLMMRKILIENDTKSNFYHDDNDQRPFSYKANKKNYYII